MDAPFRVPTAADVTLRELAREACRRAYVPYSDFRVGAALRRRDGSTITAANVENASFSLTICAERSALVRALAEGWAPGSDVEAIAVHVDGPDGQPCGACRQVIAELAPAATVSFVSGGEYVSCDAFELLPAAFVPAALEA